MWFLITNSKPALLGKPLEEPSKSILEWRLLQLDILSLDFWVLQREIYIFIPTWFKWNTSLIVKASSGREEKVLQILGSKIFHALETKNPTTRLILLPWKKGNDQSSKFSGWCSKCLLQFTSSGRVEKVLQIFGSKIFHALETKNPITRLILLPWKNGKDQNSKFSFLFSHRVWMVFKVSITIYRVSCFGLIQD